MTKLDPYLTLPGTAAEAIELYKKVFKVEPIALQKFKDMPKRKDMKISPAGAERILHAALPVGNNMLMLSDAPEGADETVGTGARTHVSITVDSQAEADRMFSLLSAGGEAVMPMAKQFWGDYYGMCRDPFGVRWMISYHEETK